jgi:hypothetical protein
MKAFLIDPFAKTITEIYTLAALTDVYTLTQCSIVEGVRLNDDDDTVYIDEEGLLKDLNQQAFFILTGTRASVTLAGRGVVFGTDQEGDWVEPTITLAELQAMIKWATLAELRANPH